MLWHVHMAVRIAGMHMVILRQLGVPYASPY